MGVGAMTHGSEVTRLGATDLGFEVPGRAQQAILGGVDVAGTSEPWILAPPSMDSKPMAKLSCIISENILCSRQALDSAFSVFGFEVRKAKFQTDP